MIKLSYIATCLILLLVSLPGYGLQYKSRLFLDSDQQLSQIEGATLEDLEQSFAALNTDYQVATTGLQIAQQYIATMQFDKAIDYLQVVLLQEGLAANVMTDVRMVLARLLLRTERYAEVLAVLKTETTSPDVAIARATAAVELHSDLSDVDYLTSLLNEDTNLTEGQLKQLTFVFYRAEKPSLAIKALERLLQRNPSDSASARQLVSLYTQQNRVKDALDLWSVFHVQAPFTAERDIKLLAALYQRQGAHEKSARLLSEAVSAGYIASTADLQYQIFTLFHTAREYEEARKHLQSSIKLSANLDQSVLLAQLMADAQTWSELLTFIKQLCTVPLPEKYVGTFNLLLGVALYKTNNIPDARRAWINATLVAGQRTEAQNWLDFIDAEPISQQEATRLWGTCLPEDPDIKVPEYEEQVAESEVINDEQSKSEKASPQAVHFDVVELPDIRLFATDIKSAMSDLQSAITARTFSLVKGILRAGAQVDGNMHLLFDGVQDQDELRFKIGLPYKGNAVSSARNKVLRLPRVKVAQRTIKVSPEALRSEWEKFVLAVLQQGHIPSGKSRMVILSDSSDKYIEAHLQLLLQ